ncbi:daunorubicin resistance ABC transporter membrane protein [Sporohalobacter salinus]|nr:ABC transporter permease [Sporohalobacter salinus]MBM7624632.1 daunorubicin resistance ABC transporter membrane protein [Sporohalobacter salinus]
MNELVAIYTLWLREIKRFYRQKSRVLGMIMQPLLFLFLIGTGLANSLAASAPYDYTQFMYPGIICMTLLFTSVSSGLSIVRDREFGFLKEVMVAPVSRISIALGKTLGGSSVAVLQGALLLLLSPLVGITLTPMVVVKVLLLMLLIAFSLTSLGILIAVPMDSMEGFQMIINFLIMPMFF